MSLTPTQKQLWRSHLAAYADIAEDYRLRRAYTQARPGTGLALPASEPQKDDCSFYTKKAFFRANKLAKLNVRDPLGSGYDDGYGNTDSCWTYMNGGGGKRIDPSASRVYFPGDVAIFDNPHTGRVTDHMMFCSVKGTAKTAKWSSHGHQSSVFGNDAPEQVSLYYASSVLKLKAVFRPAELL